MTEPTKTEPKTEAAAEPTKKDDGSLLDGPKAPEFVLDAVDADAAKGLLPEGFEPDEAELGKFLELVNGAKSRADIVSGALKMIAEQNTSGQNAMVEEWNTAQNTLRDEVKAHPTYGGDNFEKSLATARTAIETYSTNPEAVKELFKLTGAGNSVHMVDLLVKMSDAVPGESKPVEGTQRSVTQTRAESLFGT